MSLQCTTASLLLLQHLLLVFTFQRAVLVAQVLHKGGGVIKLTLAEMALSRALHNHCC